MACQACGRRCHGQHCQQCRIELRQETYHPPELRDENEDEEGAGND